MSDPLPSPAPTPPANGPGAAEPKLEDMLVRTRRFLQASLRGSLEEPIDGAKRRLATGAAGLTVSLFLIGCAVLLLLLGTVLLLSQYLTPAGACLVVGAFSLLAGVLAFTLTTRR